MMNDLSCANELLFSFAASYPNHDCRNSGLSFSLELTGMRLTTN